MRLLNATTYELESFVDENAPEYAILSHRWGDNEIDFDKLATARLDKPEEFSKIQQSCLQAIKHGLEYVWIDTCCINKSSTSELSEAINSMYRWYRQAKICYVYLHDIETTSQIHHSVWFTRGWTLQELLAPTNLSFFNANWELLGSKSDPELRGYLAEFTGIPKSALRKFKTRRYSVAQKMSWASKRTTTLVEDRTYSLLGIFGVNMVANYGEKDKAFLRLQRTIMESFDDQSILLWSGIGNSTFPFLASSPDQFIECNGITRTGDDGSSHLLAELTSQDEIEVARIICEDYDTPALKRGSSIDYLEQCRNNNLTYDGFSLTNAGLKIQLYLVPYFPHVYVAILWQCANITIDVEPSDIYTPTVNKDLFFRGSIWASTPTKPFSPKTIIHYSIGIFVERTRTEGTYNRVTANGKNWMIVDKQDWLKYGQLKSVLLTRERSKERSLPEGAYGICVRAPEKWWYRHMLEALTGQELSRRPAKEQIHIFYRRMADKKRLLFGMEPGEIGLTCMVYITANDCPAVLIQLGFDVDFTGFCLCTVVDGPHVNGESTMIAPRQSPFHSYPTLQMIRKIRNQSASLSMPKNTRLFTVSRQYMFPETYTMGRIELQLLKSYYGFELVIDRRDTSARPNPMRSVSDSVPDVAKQEWHVANVIDGRINEQNHSVGTSDMQERFSRLSVEIDGEDESNQVQ